MFDVKDIKNLVNTLHAFCEHEALSSIEAIIENADLEEVFETAYQEYQNENLELEVLNKIIDILSYLENETHIPSPVSDTIYDKILGVLDENDITNIGTNSNIIDDDTVREHQYPELRGSLQKVHFTTSDEIPKKDSRKSLEDFFENTLYGCVHLLPKGVFHVYVDYKWDGASNVFECDKTDIEYVLTRYKVELNLGKDVSHVYKSKTAKDIFGYKIPGQLYDMGNYGVKVEVIMPIDKFEEYKKYTMDTKCNRRSAVASITNRKDDNLDPKLLDFLEVIPLQISTEVPIEGNPDVIVTEGRKWVHVGIINDRHQYVAMYFDTKPYEISDEVIMALEFKELAELVYKQRVALEADAESKGYPIDGMVITLSDWELVHALGREHHKNRFQVAFKFPAGIKKTKIKNVIFQVGPIAGTITPVAEVEPIVMNGNTITHVGLSNMEKLERLNLHIGDEILIQYDIIPKIIVDETCQKTNGKQIVAITECPVCHEEIKNGRCLNPDCDAKIVGRIAGFTKKMNIPNFGIETVTDLVNRGFLTSITSLYKLGNVAGELLRIPGYQDKSVSNLVNAPLGRTNVYPHELLGSIGIPDISLSTMEKVCRHIPWDQLINDPSVLISMYQNINGIGEIKAVKIIEGIDRNKKLILELLPWFTFKNYEKESESQKLIMFTNVRDAKFVEYLQHNFDITTPKNDGFSAKAIALIVPDGIEIKSTKKDKAIEKGIPIMTITEAKKKWGYEG